MGSHEILSSMREDYDKEIRCLHYCLHWPYISCKLQCIIKLATQKGILNNPELPKAAKLRCSLYVDDAAIFTNPDAIKLTNLQKILHIFGECSGTKINMEKTEIIPIRMDNDVLSSIVENFPWKIGKFLGKYLGLPLHTRKLRKVEIQPLIDKVGARLPGWKGILLSSAGRETLVKTVLSSQPIYHLTVFPEQKMGYQEDWPHKTKFLMERRNPR